MQAAADVRLRPEVTTLDVITDEELFKLHTEASKQQVSMKSVIDSYSKWIRSLNTLHEELTKSWRAGTGAGPHAEHQEDPDLRCELVSGRLLGVGLAAFRP